MSYLVYLIEFTDKCSNFYKKIFSLLVVMACFPSGSVVKNLPSNAGDEGPISGSGRYTEGGLGNPLQYLYLRNPMGRGARWSTVHGVKQHASE